MRGRLLPIPPRGLERAGDAEEPAPAVLAPQLPKPPSPTSKNKRPSGGKASAKEEASSSKSASGSKRAKASESWASWGSTGAGDRWDTARTASTREWAWDANAGGKWGTANESNESSKGAWSSGGESAIESGGIVLQHSPQRRAREPEPQVSAACQLEGEHPSGSGFEVPISDKPIRRIGDPEYWDWARCHSAYSGWSDMEVIGTIWPANHPDAVQKALEVAPDCVKWRKGMPTLVLDDDDIQ
jgi:hypothetical protein